MTGTEILLGEKPDAGARVALAESLQTSWIFHRDKPKHTPGLDRIGNDINSSFSTHFHKYGDVCWERDGAQIEARRRVDAGTSARRSNKKMGPSRPNPSGGGGLRAISLSLVVVDVPASTPPLFATSPRKPHPQTLPYLLKGVLRVCPLHFFGFRVVL